MTEPRVYIVQQPATFDRGNGGFVAKYDLSPAKQFGKLVFIMPPGNVFLHQLPAATLHMRNVLAGFQPCDFLLAIGDPILIAAAAMIAGQKTGGELRMLKWDRFKV